MPVDIRTGLFRDTGTAPTVFADLQEAITDALGAASAAETAASTANTAATSAAASATAASTAISGAIAALDAAVVVATDTINTVASGAVSAAAASASAASTSATNASASATAAGSSAAAAATSQGQASTSASNAATSASSAATSASSASASASSASTSATAAAASATAAGAIVAALSGRNALLNGGMQVWNRGTSFTPAANTVTYLADRWRNYHDGTGGTTTVTRQLAETLPAAVTDAGASQALRYNVTALPTSPTLRQITQAVEGVGTLAGRTVTASFWVWTGTGTAACTVSLGQVFGTGGSPSSTVNIAGQTFTATTTPQRIIRTFTLPSITGMTLGTNGDDHLVFVVRTPTAATHDLWITDVALEPGATATVFERLPLAVTQTQCGRYWRRVVGGLQAVATAGAQTLGTRVPVFPPMRGTPNVSVTDLGSSGGTDLAATATADAVNFTLSSSAAGAVTIHAEATLISEL